jgi:hypothetical protein
MQGSMAKGNWTMTGRWVKSVSQSTTASGSRTVMECESFVYATLPSTHTTWTIRFNISSVHASSSKPNWPGSVMWLRPSASVREHFNERAAKCVTRALPDWFPRRRAPNVVTKAVERWDVGLSGCGRREWVGWRSPPGSASARERFAMFSRRRASTPDHRRFNPHCRLAMTRIVRKIPSLPPPSPSLARK